MTPNECIYVYECVCMSASWANIFDGIFAHSNTGILADLSYGCIWQAADNGLTMNVVIEECAKCVHNLTSTRGQVTSYISDHVQCAIYRFKWPEGFVHRAVFNYSIFASMASI